MQAPLTTSPPPAAVSDAQEALAQALAIEHLEKRFASAGHNPASRALLHAMIVHRLRQHAAASDKEGEDA